MGIKEDITKIYVGYYDRAPDPAGLNYWIGRANAGMTLSEIANSFAVQTESTTKYPYLANPLVASADSFIDSVYMNLFNRAPDAAGKAYWLSELAGGKPVGQMIIDIMSGAKDDANGNDKSVLDNKVAVGVDFAEDLANLPNLNYESNDAAKAAASKALDAVTDDAATVTAAKAETDAFVAGGGGAGQTFTLTGNQDALTGTTANDTFNAGAVQDGNGSLIDSLQNVDTLDGDDGVDTLNVTDSEGNTNTPVLKNIENVNIRFTNSGEYDFSASSGVQTVTVEGSSTSGDLDSVGAIDTFVIKNTKQSIDIDDSTATTLNLTFDTVGSAGAQIGVDLGDTTAAKATTANITAKDAHVDIDSSGGADVIKTATIAATGTNDIEFSDSATTLETLTVTGSGSVDLTDDALNALKTLDASASTGVIQVSVDNTAESVKSGSGADKLTVSTATNAALALDAGDGNDTVTVGGALTAGGTVDGGAGKILLY